MIKKLNTTPLGGMPLDLDDFEWMQSGIDETFKALAYGIPRPGELKHCKLIGCEVTNIANPGGYSIPLTLSEGYIILDGQIRKVDAVAIFEGDPDTVGNLCWVAEDLFDASGNEQFFDGSSQDTYLQRKAKLEGFPTVDDDVRPRDSVIKYLADMIRSYVNLEPDWVNINPDSGWSASIQPKYRLANDLTVRLRGVISCDGAGSGPTIFTLPAGKRPLQDCFFLLPRISTIPIALRGIYIKIATDGTVSFQGNTEAGAAMQYGSSYEFDLTPISFPTL